MAYKILIVDDSLPMRSVLKKTITASGFGKADFFEAENGKKALEIMEKEWLDIVVTDFNMPEMNGIELLREMKNNKQIEPVPVLVVTTEGSKLKIEEFSELGASGYIKKPFTPEEIKEKLTQILGEAEYDTAIEEGDNDLDF